MYNDTCTYYAQCVNTFNLFWARSKSKCTTYRTRLGSCIQAFAFRSHSLALSVTFCGCMCANMHTCFHVHNYTDCHRSTISMYVLWSVHCSKKSTPYEWFVDHMWLNYMFTHILDTFLSFRSNGQLVLMHKVSSLLSLLNPIFEHDDHLMLIFSSVSIRGHTNESPIIGSSYSPVNGFRVGFHKPFLILNVQWFINCQSLAVVIRPCFDLNAIVTLIEHSDKMVSYIMKRMREMIRTWITHCFTGLMCTTQWSNDGMQSSDIHKLMPEAHRKHNRIFSGEIIILQYFFVVVWNEESLKLLTFFCVLLERTLLLLDVNSKIMCIGDTFSYRRS